MPHLCAVGIQPLPPGQLTNSLKTNPVRYLMFNTIVREITQKTYVDSMPLYMAAL
ncbi:MAG: hypothetical protein ACPL3C_08760 [Pyrobaculum sp.]|jgi:hypothetical protein|uniref:hypothetical protein n=1 Tax=Pyrobaculum sp. TaxID=2004705 RepID=UPI003CA30716